MALSKELDNIQKTIICIHRKLFGESPSPMKLQKLCYYVQGYALAKDGELFSDGFQAWQHGPVILDLYSKYKNYQWHPINEEFGDATTDQSNYAFLENIVSAYGRYDGAALSTMTHRETPWLSARGNLNESEGSSAIIDKKSLRDFFAAKLRAND